MASFTQKAIARTFVALLNERPLDKITVTDIVEQCGVSRNTFYYHYPDMFALIDELFRAETARIMEDTTTYASWQEAFLQATGFALENKRAIYHLYNSLNRDRVEQYLGDVIRRSVSAFVTGQAAGLAVPSADVDAMTEFYTAALVGLMVQWVREDMKRDPETYIRRIGRLLDGNIRDAFRRAAGADKIE